MNVEILNDLTLEEIEVAIDQRCKLLRILVGTLYPTIVIDEIEQLYERKSEIERILNNEE